MIKNTNDGAFLNKNYKQELLEEIRYFFRKERQETAAQSAVVWIMRRKFSLAPINYQSVI